MNDKTTSPAFLARRGPSDRDEAAWHEFRKTAISASEVRGLWLIKGDRTNAIRRLIKEKITGERWQGNKYTDWGKSREDALEDWANFAYGYIPETRAAYAEDNRQHVASIDAWRIDPDDLTIDLAEFKTDGEPITFDIAFKRGYTAQMNWQYHVTGASKGRLLWEERLDDMGGFRPGVRGVIDVPRDEDLIADLIKIADDFLERLMRAMIDGLPDEEVDARLGDLVDRWQGAKQTAAELEQEVRDWMANAGMTGAKVESGALSLVASAAPMVKDPAAFAAAYPEEAAELERLQALAETFKKQGTQPKPTLKFTPAKGKA